MSDGAQGSRKAKKLAVRALMWIGAAAVLVWIFRRVPLDDALGALDMLRPAPFIAVIVVFSLFTLLLDTATHYWLFNRFNPPLDFLSTLRCRGETYLLLSLGFLYGQGGMAYAVSRRAGKPLAEVTGSILFIMLSTLISLMLFPTLAMLFFVREATAPGFRSSPEWGIVAKWLMISWPLIVLHFVFWSKRWNNPLRRKLVGGLARAFDAAGPKDYAIALGLRLVQAMAWCVFTWLGLRAFSARVPLFDLMALGPLVGLVNAVPTPGRIGPGQAAWLLLFSNLVAPAVLVAFSILWVMAVNVMRWLIGALFLALPGAGPLRRPSGG